MPSNDITPSKNGLYFNLNTVLGVVLGPSAGFHGRNYPARRKAFDISMIITVRSGSIVAIVTPMMENNAIDYVKLDSLLKWHIQEGIKASGLQLFSLFALLIPLLKMKVLMAL